MARRERSIIAYKRERKRNVANLCGEDQRAEEQSVQDPIQRRDIDVSLHPPQVEQRDENGRGTRPAPPDDIRDELFETAVLAVHPV